MRTQTMTIEQLLYHVQHAGFDHGAVVYNILFRNAGVGVLWHEEARAKKKVIDLGNGVVRNPFVTGIENTEAGLVVYRYRRTLREALRWELQRLKRLGESDS